MMNTEIFTRGRTITLRTGMMRTGIPILIRKTGMTMVTLMKEMAAVIRKMTILMRKMAMRMATDLISR